jgi:mannose-6-phosphate isomerase-like protein (cupin superfamily)
VVNLAGPAAPPAGTAFPGATALTLLDVYDWLAPDGVRGGSAHVHLASTEGYVVLSGEGRLQTLGSHGYAETPLSTGNCVWFTPGVIHRLVNERELRLLVIMQNAGLPEAGDAVLTFPPELLADPAAYAAAAALGSPGPAAPDSSPGPDLEEAARRRRDLAITGYLALRGQVVAEGPGALGGFFAAAARLVAGRVPQWRERWRGGALAAATLTGAHLDGIAAGQAEYLAACSVHRASQAGAVRSYGMCGRLSSYRPVSP